MLTAVTALPLFNQMLLASLNPSLAHVRGVRVHLLEYVFVLLLTILTVACVKIIGAVLVEALLLIPAAASRNLNRSIRGFVLLEHRVLDGQLPHRRLRADALGSAGAVGRRDHPDVRRHLPRDDDHSHDPAALSRSLGLIHGGLIVTKPLTVSRRTALGSTAACPSRPARGGQSRRCRADRCSRARRPPTRWPLR